MLKKQGIPDDMIRMLTTIISERQEELDMTNEETFLASLNKAMEKLIYESVPFPPVGKEDEDDEEVDYSELSPKELFKLCKERNIDVPAKKPAKFYIKKLEEYDASNDEEEGWDDEEEEEDDWEE